MRRCDGVRKWFRKFPERRVTFTSGLLGKVMRRYDAVRKWFKTFPSRLVIFTFGLLFSKGMMTFVMANFMTFLTDFWNLKLINAVTIVNLRDGLKDMLQIYIALCIDAFLGYRLMLIVSSALYSVGLVLLAFSVPQYFFNNEKVCPMEKVDCFKKLKHNIPFWEGLVLLILGGAAQVIPLHSLSFEQAKVIKVPEQSAPPTREKFGCCFSKYKIGGWRHLQPSSVRLPCTAFVMLGSITSVYGLIRFQSKWHQRFLISAISIVFGLLWFLCGSPFYGPRLLQPSPFSTMLHVLIAAVRRRHLDYQQNSQQLRRGDGDDQNQLLTDHFKFLNNAAVEVSSADERKKTKGCTVKEVEQTKLLLNMFPMSVTFIVYGMVKSLGNTFFVEQAKSINGGTVVLFQIIQYASKSAVNRGYELVFEKRIKRIKRQYSDGVKIGLGMLASIACCTIARYGELKRLKAPREEDTAHISVFWMLLQFFFLGAMEGLAGNGIEDFFCHYTPDSRRYGPVFNTSLTGFGTLLNIVFIIVLHYCSKFRYKESWLGHTINQSHLESIYLAYTIVALLNGFLYAYVSTWYSYDNIVGRPEEENEIPFLEVKEGGETAAGNQQDNQGQGEIELNMVSMRS